MIDGVFSRSPCLPVCLHNGWACLTRFHLFEEKDPKNDLGNEVAQTFTALPVSGRPLAQGVWLPACADRTPLRTALFMRFLYPNLFVLRHCSLANISPVYTDEVRSSSVAPNTRSSLSQTTSFGVNRTSLCTARSDSSRWVLDIETTKRRCRSVILSCLLRWWP